MRSDSANLFVRLSGHPEANAQRGGVRSIAEVLSELWSQYQGLLADGPSLVADLCHAADLPRPSTR